MVCPQYQVLLSHPFKRHWCHTLKSLSVRLLSGQGGQVGSQVRVSPSQQLDVIPRHVVSLCVLCQGLQILGCPLVLVQASSAKGVMTSGDI